MFSDHLRRRLACLLILLAPALACQPRKPTPVQRLAVLPFENLSGDPSLDWVGPALREGVVLSLQGRPNLRAGMFHNARDAASANADLIIDGYYVRTAGRLRLEAVQRPATSGKASSRRRFEAPPAEESLPRLCNALAQWIEPGASPLETSSGRALRALAEGRLSPDLPTAVETFERGAQADPGFGPLYAAWAQTLIQHRQFAPARAVLARAQQQNDRISELRRRELAVLEARLAGDRAGLLQALTALAALLPSDTGLQIEVSREEIAAGRYDDALERLRRAVRTDPQEPTAWNELGYAEARKGNLKEAQDALNRYRELAPGEANPLDSLGDVLYHFGAFDQAAQSYQDAFRTDPSFLAGATLYKAARAKLMQGDLDAADALFSRYVELRKRAGDPLAAFAAADWFYLTGRREAATNAMKSIARSAAGELADLAGARLSLWALLEGRHEQALTGARDVLRRTQAPLAHATALLVLVAVQGPGWEAVPEGPFRHLGIACRTLLARQFENAARILKPLVDATDPLSQDQLAALLAWALIESGRESDAAPLLAAYGTPPAGLEPPAAFFTFPRVLALKAKALAAQGRTAEAQHAEAAYRRLTSAAR